MQNSGHAIVVDTSVIVKFLVKEPDSANANALFERMRSGAVKLIAPDFVFIELTNTLWRKTRQGELAETEAKEKLSEFLAIAPSLEVVAVAAFLPETLRLALLYAHAAYDAAFLALAESRGVRFVTADQKFYSKVRRYAQVLLLRDLPTA